MASGYFTPYLCIQVFSLSFDGTRIAGKSHEGRRRRRLQSKIFCGWHSGRVDSAALGILYISFKTVIHRACRPFPFSTESEVCLGFLVLQFFLDHSLQEIRPRRL